MAAETQYTANTGMVIISSGNPLLNGGGALGTVLTGASNGTLIKTVSIKAQGTTTHGMVRLFIYDGTNTKLISEVEIPAVTRTVTDPAFEISIPMDYSLKSGWSLKASTEQNENL